MSEKHIGEVVQVIGPVLDIRFAHDELPPLLNAIEIDNDGAKLVGGRLSVRLTEGLQRSAFACKKLKGTEISEDEIKDMEDELQKMTGSLLSPSKSGSALAALILLYF